MVAVEHIGTLLNLCLSQDQFANIYGEGLHTERNRARKEMREWILGELVLLAAILMFLAKYYDVLCKVLSLFLSPPS